MPDNIRAQLERFFVVKDCTDCSGGHPPVFRLPSTASSTLLHFKFPTLLRRHHHRLGLAGGY